MTRFVRFAAALLAMAVGSMLLSGCFGGSDCATVQGPSLFSMDSVESLTNLDLPEKKRKNKNPNNGC